MGKKQLDDEDYARKERILKQRAKRKKKQQKKRKKTTVAVTAAILIVAVTGMACFLTRDHNDKNTEVLTYEAEHYNKSVFQTERLFASDLCVALENRDKIQYSGSDDVHAAGLFDLDSQSVLYADNIHERLYPASTTKIMTALLALEKGNLSDMVTVGKNADGASFPWDAQLCGLKEGDRLTLEDLLYGLLLHSGNDAGTAIAEYISGSEEAFVKEMNQKAKELMAVNTHYMNPHGLHDVNHYTTAYDLYLIFNECIKNEEFVKIMETDSYTASIKGADGSVREEVWTPTNYYAKGITKAPEGVTVLGGKTGTTGEAGNCLILLDHDKQNRSYISVVMGAGTKNALYEDMNALLQGAAR